VAKKVALRERYMKVLVAIIMLDIHFFWTNFHFTPFKGTKRGIRRQDHDFRLERIDFDLSKFNLDKIFEKQVANNCVEPEVGLHILNESKRNIRPDLFK
jgi:hypothetical protein